MARRDGRYILMLLVLLGCLGVARLGFASGIELVVSDVSLSHRYTPILANGGFAVPIQLASQLGAEVKEVGERHVIRYQGKEAWVRSGVNDEETSAAVKNLAITPVSIDGELYVPLRFLADLLRLQVSWDAGRRVLTLNPWTRLGSLANQLQAREPAGPPGAVAVEPTPTRPTPESVETAAVHTGTPSPVATLVNLVQPSGEAYITPIASAGIVPVPVPFAPPTLRKDPTLGIWASLHDATGIAFFHDVHTGTERYTFRAKGELSIESALIVDPFRLVLDFKGVDGGSFEPYPIQTRLVQQIRARSEGDHLRMVLDLEVGVGHRVEQVSPNEVALILQRPLTSVTVDSEERGGQITFDVNPMTPHRVVQLESPDRVVVDLERTTLIGGPLQIEVAEGPVATVRAAQFNAEVTRVVLDLRQPTPFKLRHESSSLVFAYGETAAGLLAYRPANDRELQIGILVDADREITVTPLSHPDRIAIDVPGAQLEKPVQDAFIDIGPAYRLRASQFDENTVRIVADLRYFVHHRVYRDGGRTVVALQQPLLTGSRITIDAGHGGHDPGAISHSLGMTENVLNLDIAERLEALITGAEGTVKMTRTDDTYVDLWGRADRANEFESDVFVSIHHNASHSETQTASGTETYVKPAEGESVRLGEAVHKSVISAAGTRDRGVRPNPGYIVLNRAKVPAILVEVAFMTHVEDEELLIHDWFRQRAAEGIFNGILRYFHPQENAQGSSSDGDPFTKTTTMEWTPLGERDSTSI